MQRTAEGASFDEEVIGEPIPDGRVPGGRMQRETVIRAIGDRGLAFALGAVSLLIGLVRIWDHVPFWRDEVSTGVVVDRPFGAFVHVLTTQEAGMGPYYVATWVWSRISLSDEWLRAFSAVGASVAVGLCYFLCRAWYGRAVAVAATVVLALNPFMLRHATDTRAYSWVTAGGLAIVLAALRARRVRTLACAALLGALVGLTVATHVLFVFVLAPLVLAWWWCDRGDHWWRSRRFLTAPVVAVAVFAPFAGGLLGYSGQGDWIDKPNLDHLWSDVSSVFGGTRSTLVLAGGWVLAAVALATRKWPPRSLKHVVPLAVTVLTVVGMLAVSLVQPIFVPRYALPVLPFGVIASITGYSTVRVRDRRVLIGAVTAVSLLVFVVRDPLHDVPRPDDMRAATAYLTGEVRSGDIVLFAPKSARVALSWYSPGPLPGDVAAPAPDPDVFIPTDLHTPDVLAAVLAAPRVWVVGYSEEGPEGGELTGLLATDLAERPVVSTTVVGGITFELLGPTGGPG